LNDYIHKVKRLTYHTMPSTIKDVAKKANVSIATVSLVIHNNKRISTETKKKVKRAIKELDYHPTRSAMGLVSRTSGNIGFILTEDHFSRSEPFYTKIFLGTEFQARENEYYVLLTTIPSNSCPDSKIPRFLLEKNVDGIILAGKVPPNFIEKLKRFKIPTVFVDYFPNNGSYPTVMVDNINGGFQSTNHLISCNHNKIAFIAGDIEHPSISERFQGYKMALEKAKIPYTPSLAVVDEPHPSRECGYSAIKKLLNKTNDFTAIFACNDAMALGVLQYLKEKGVSVPGDKSLIGFDDVESDLSLDPPLTTMKVPKVEMGIEATKLMLEILRKKSNGLRKILIPTELVVRKSTCVYQN
jgi:LacI family transcriptional regulator